MSLTILEWGLSRSNNCRIPTILDNVSQCHARWPDENETETISETGTIF